VARVVYSRRFGRRAARVNNSRHIVSGIWLHYLFNDHNSLLRGVCFYHSVVLRRDMRDSSGKMPVVIFWFDCCAAARDGKILQSSAAQINGLTN